jgi:DNA-binding CsgD family transcriptional regulator
MAQSDQANGEKRLLVPLFVFGATGAQLWLPLIHFGANEYRMPDYSIIGTAPPFIAWFAAVAMTALLFMLSRSKDASRLSQYASVAGGGLSILGAMMFLLEGMIMSQGRMPFLLLSGAVLGIGNGLLAMVWGTLADLLSNRQAMLVMSLAATLSCLLFGFAQSGADPLALCCAVCILFGVSLLCSRRLACGACGCGPEHVLTAQSFKKSASIFVRAAISSACFGFIFAAMVFQFTGAEHGRAGWYTWLFGFAGLAVSIALLASGHCRDKPRDALFVYRLLPLPIIIAFFPFNGGTEFSLVLAMCFSVVAIWCYMLIAPMVWRQCALALKVSISYAAGAAAAGLFAGAVLGLLLAMLIEGFGIKAEILPISVTAIISMSLSVIATNIILTKGELLSASSKALLAGQAMDPSDANDLLLNKLQLICGRFGLTKREAEVLRILSSGYNLKRLQRELFISEGTAITHRRRIYQKLGVHSKDELIDFVVNYVDPDALDSR